ncbi:PREDICTED: butyrophilin-like protein 9 [Acanthisitta chloris]|uniref:butyrophilin-like protein 9 n=1 Tax=Acanthisitta chloris TaxID=57068 RepID=UPI0004F0E6D9|nr:PREDICTED: butyrophilin-like protein 9 [Acanthisitta chloris]
MVGSGDALGRGWTAGQGGDASLVLDCGDPPPVTGCAKGVESSVFLDGHVGHGIGLTCKSQGWFPEPQVVWLNSKGQPRMEKVTTRSTLDSSSGIFNVMSSMNLEPGADHEVTCRVVNGVLNATCESRIRISDSFFPATSPWMTSSIVILCLDLAVVGLVVYKTKSSISEASEAGEE